MNVKRSSTVILLSLVATLAACRQPNNTLHLEDASKMQIPKSDMVTRCVGRYLIDLPKNTVDIVFAQTIEDVTIEIKPVTQLQFSALLSRKQKELEGERTRSQSAGPTLKSIDKVAGTNGVIFDRAESKSSNVLRVLELFAWSENHLIHMTIKSRDMSYSTDVVPADTRKTTTLEKKAHLLNVFSRTRIRGLDVIPTGQGVCIANGFIAGKPTSQEEVTYLVGLQNADDVYFRIATSSLYSRDTTLKSRSANIESIISENGGRIIRNDKLNVGPIIGEQLVYSIIDGESSATPKPMTNKFTFEGNNKVGSAEFPLVSIDLDNGIRPSLPDQGQHDEIPEPITKASLTEAEAMLLWDSVTTTLRARPGAF